MTNVQKLTVRSSEIRSRLNEIIDVPDAELTDALRAESDKLTVEARDVDTKLRAAIVAEGDNPVVVAPTDDPESRERRELRSRSRLSRYVESALLGKAPTGAEDEYAAAMGCPGMLPISMLGPTTEERQSEHARRIETRAVTPAPADSDVPHTHAPIVPALFDQSIAPYLGIEMPTVGTGLASFPVLSTSVTAGMAPKTRTR